MIDPELLGGAHVWRAEAAKLDSPVEVAATPESVVSSSIEDNPLNVAVDPASPSNENVGNTIRRRRFQVKKEEESPREP